MVRSRMLKYYELIGSPNPVDAFLSGGRAQATNNYEGTSSSAKSFCGDNLQAIKLNKRQN